MFSSLRGHEAVVRQLRRSLREGRVHHAYLFTGPPGVGKAEMAEALTLALVCRRERDEGCGECDSCRKALSGNHSDVIHVRAAEGKRRILIGQIRQLQQGMRYRPYEGRHRVLIVHGADNMTEEAANALLKTLEEPPPVTHFVLLTTRPEDLLDTIRSRCQRLRFAPLSREVVAQTLQSTREELSPEQAWVVAGLAAGSLGRAEEILEGELIEERSELLESVLAIGPEDPEALLNLSESWYRERDRVLERIDLLVSWYRDLLVRVSGGSDRHLIHSDWWAGEHPRVATSPSGALRCLQLLLEAREGIAHRNANVRLTLEHLLLGLAIEKTE